MLALYRKYRPSGFEEVIGQRHVTKTLENQVKAGRISHAYLFTGSRGTGKTTCARIFARAINCLSPRNGSPCGECEACKAIASKENVDVFELDAASNNSVDQMRTLIESVQYLPAVGKYKIYIIDEVHMLSAQAFNALLKTLEEPPKHVIFILATTEVHKVLPTILSRCMRFDFKLVSHAELCSYLKLVYEREGVKATDEAISLIATMAEGSVRDMLSLADRVMGGGETLTYEVVSNILGTGGRQGVKKLYEAIKSGDIGVALEVVNTLCAEGKSVSLIAKDIVSYLRDLLVIKTSSKATVLGNEEELAEMREKADEVSVDFLVTAITVFSAIDAEIRYSVSPKIVLETATLRVIKQAVTDLSALEERIARLEKKIASGIAVAVEPKKEDSENPVLKARASKSMEARSVWGRVMTYIRENESTMAFSSLKLAEEVEITGDELKVWVTPENLFRFSDDSIMNPIKRALEADGTGLKLVVDKVKGGVNMDTEIDRIKRLIGEAKLNIKKK